MKKLKLPIIRETLHPAKYLSMDDYLKFVNLLLKYTVDRKNVRKQKKTAVVNVPFEMR